jgi:hypothetical protein
VIRAKFHLAVIYAKTAMTNAALKEGYAAVRRCTQTAFNVAFLHAYNGPVLSDLHTDRFEGAPGQPIVVHAPGLYSPGGELFPARHQQELSFPASLFLTDYNEAEPWNMHEEMVPSC